jgi:predicted DNA-binding antitoxin AbrB/MazE fold protein
MASTSIRSTQGAFMTIEVDATYENGVLRLDQPLPFKEHERVKVSVNPTMSRARRAAGMMGWTGDPEILRHIAESPEAGKAESK